jgi:hypothetical protein
MAPLILLAILPLDLIDPAPAPAPAAAANGLRIEATVENRRVCAVLTNVGARPIEAEIGYSCSGPDPFEAIVDGTAKSFVDPATDCSKNVPQTAALAPGEQRRVDSRSVILDGNPHRVAVRYRSAGYERGTWRGQLTSATIQVPAGDPNLPLQLSRGEIVAGMRAVSGRVHACFDAYKEPGTAMVSVQIVGDGSVRSATVLGKLAGTQTAQCLTRAVESASFRKFSGSPMSISYPFILR